MLRDFFKFSFAIALATLLLSVFVSACEGEAAPTPTTAPREQALVGDTPTPTSIATSTPSPAPSETPTPENTPSPTPIDTPIPPTDTPTLEPTATLTPEPSATHTPVPTDTPVPSPTNTPTSEPTDTPVPTDTPTRVPTETPVHTNTPTPIPTDTPTPVPTDTPTPIPTDTPIPTPTDTPTPIATPTPELQNTPQSDRAALIAIYEATDGANWTNNANWLSNQPIGTWFGVTTDHTGRVIELALINNNLNGDIPADVGGLFSLTVLALWDNQLTGEIPTELGDLANLRSLTLDANDLSGNIPAELGNLGNLTELWLGGNRITGCLPDGLTDVSYIDLRLMPCAERNALVALHEATDGDNWADDANWLSNKPLDEWYGITTNPDGQVIQLDLSNNKLNGEIPAELGDLSNLAGLFVFANNLTGEIPEDLGNLTSLTRLFIGGNQFDGCIPEALQDVPDHDLPALGLPVCGFADVDTLDQHLSLVAFSNSSDLINLTWSIGSRDVARQEIFRNSEKIIAPPLGQMWFIDKGLDPNTRYEYRIEIELEDGPLVTSEIAAAATLSHPPLFTPMNVNEKGFAVAIIDDFNPSWTTYRVTLSNEEQAVTSDWDTSRCRTFDDLQAGTDYRFEVAASNLDGIDSVPVYQIYYGGPDTAEYWGTQRSTGVEDAWIEARIDEIVSLYGLSAGARQWMMSDIRAEWVRNEPGYAGYIAPDLVKSGSETAPAGLMHEFMHGYFEHWNGFSESCDAINIYTFRRDVAQFMLDFREYDQLETPNPWENWRPFYSFFHAGIVRDYRSTDGKSAWDLFGEGGFNELWGAIYHVAETEIPAIVAGKLSLIPPPLQRYFEAFITETEETRWLDELRWYSNLNPTDLYLWDTAFQHQWILVDSPEIDLFDPSLTTTIPDPLRQQLRNVDRSKLIDFVNTLEDISCSQSCEKLWEADPGFWAFYVSANLHRSQFYLDELSTDIGIELEQSNLEAIQQTLGMLVSDLYCGDASVAQLRTSINAVSDVSDLQKEALLQMIDAPERGADRWYVDCVQ